MNTTFKNLAEVTEFAAYWAELEKCIGKKASFLPSFNHIDWIDHSSKGEPSEWNNAPIYHYLRNNDGCIEIELTTDDNVEFITLYDSKNNIVEVLN